MGRGCRGSWELHNFTILFVTIMEEVCEWVFPSREVDVTERIIGRGAFGEVRVAKWRSIYIACKRLHAAVASDTHAQEVLEGMEAEMEILSKLRHPNLVLFLGVCVSDVDYQKRITQSSSAITLNGRQPVAVGDDEDQSTNSTKLTTLPTMILTELMPCSLYDIMEVHKVQLTLAEILDISLDISYGLRYLHGNNPSIIHRDISAKNILIGGNRAKIADLGQAKIFGTSALSRQTSMPGAMAYSAPEVLTGKYSTKIDIFSLGVLLVQLVSNEYPRIEKREEQLSKACGNFQAVFNSLMTSCIDFIPASRPDIEQVIEELELIKSNDRFYPPLRRLSPQSDVGVMARKWMNDHIDEVNRDVKLSYELVTKQLAAEQQRWLEEASRVDELRRTLSEKDDAVAVVTAAAEEKDLMNEQLTRKVARLTDALNGTVLRLNKNETDNHHVRERLKEVEVQHHLESLKLAKAEEARKESEHRAEHLQRTFVTLQGAETQATEREKETKQYLDMQVDQNRELEARLEQALHRWRLEKETGTQETEKYIKMRSTCATLVEQLDHATIECQQFSARLGQYDNLPLPDEIRVRFRDMTTDIEKLTDNLERQRQRHEDLLNQHDLLENKLRETTTDLIDLEARFKKKSDDDKEKGRTISSLNSRLAAAAQEASYHKRRIGELEEENALLTDSEAELTDKLRETEERLQLEVRRMQLRAAIAAQSVAQPGGDSRAVSRSGGRRASNQEGETAAERGDATATGTGSTTTTGASSGAGTGSNTSTTAAGGEGGEGGEGGDVDIDTMTEDQMLELEGKKRERTERELKREVAHAIEEGVGGLVRLLRANVDNEKLSWRVPRALRELAIKDEGARKECVDEQCDELFLASMQAFPQSAVVQAQCLRLLGTLAFGNDQVRRSAGERGVVRMIAYAMQRHGDEDESVVLHACTALTNLMHNSLENRSRFLEISGVDLLVRLMEAHKETATIQRQVCWTILTLAGSDDASRDVVASGGASAIVNAMAHHRTDPGVQQFGCWALGNLALAGEDNRRKLRKVGALEVARMAIEQHAGHGEVLRQARQLLAVMGAVKS